MDVDKTAVRNIAMVSLKALNDTRVMVPADATSALADLKNVLRLLSSGEMELIQPRQQAAPLPAGDGEE